MSPGAAKPSAHLGLTDADRIAAQQEAKRGKDELFDLFGASVLLGQRQPGANSFVTQRAVGCIDATRNAGKADQSEVGDLANGWGS